METQVLYTYITCMTLYKSYNFKARSLNYIGVLMLDFIKFCYLSRADTLTQLLMYIMFTL